MADTLAVQEYATKAELYRHVNHVLCSQIVVVVVFLFAIAQKPATRLLF